MNRSASHNAKAPPQEGSGRPLPDLTSAVSAAHANADRPKPEWLLEVERRLQGHRSLLETLTDEDREFFRNYDGPEVLGPPPPPPMKRRPSRRGET